MCGKKTLQVHLNNLLGKHLETDRTEVRAKKDLPVQFDQSDVKVEGFSVIQQSLGMDLDRNLELCYFCRNSFTAL